MLIIFPTDSEGYSVGDSENCTFYSTDEPK